MAKVLGYIDVELMLSRIPFWKLLRWIEYCQLEELGGMSPKRDKLGQVIKKHAAPMDPDDIFNSFVARFPSTPPK